MLLFIQYQNKNFVVKDDAPSKELKFKKLGYLEDRSELSEEMADLCKKQPIYQLAEADYADKVPDVDMKQPTAGRKLGLNYSLYFSSAQCDSRTVSPLTLQTSSDALVNFETRGNSPQNGTVDHLNSKNKKPFWISLSRCCLHSQAFHRDIKSRSRDIHKNQIDCHNM